MTQMIIHLQNKLKLATRRTGAISYDPLTGGVSKPHVLFKSVRSIFIVTVHQDHGDSKRIRNQNFSSSTNKNSKSHVDLFAKDFKDQIAYLKRKLSGIDKGYDPKHLSFLLEQWKTLIPIINSKNSNRRTIQRNLELEILRLNQVNHEWAPTKKELKSFFEKEWKPYPFTMPFVQSYFETVFSKYKFERLLTWVFSELEFLFVKSGPLKTLDRANLSFMLARTFHGLYCRLEFAKTHHFHQAFEELFLNPKETYLIGEDLLHRLIDRKLVEVEKTKGGKFKNLTLFKLSDKSSLTPPPSLFISIDHLPLVCKPTSWVNCETKDGTSTLGGGYLLKHFSYEQICSSKKNSSLLRYSEEALASINYLQQMPFQIDKKNLKFVIRQLEHFLKQEEEIEILPFENFEDYYQSLEKPNSELAQRYHYLDKKNKYLSQREKINKTITALFFALLFAEHALFFVIFADFRGRIYRRGLALNPQGGMLSKWLLKLEGKTFGKAKQKTLRLDASASGFSIYGMLSGDEKLLELTRILTTKDLPEDFYIHIQTVLEKQFPYVSKVKASNGTPLIDRQVIKKALVPYMYNEGLFGTTNRLREVEGLKEALLPFFTNKKDPILCFAKDLRKLIHLCFPIVGVINRFVYQTFCLSGKKNPFILIDNVTSGAFRSQMFYQKYETKTSYLSKRKTFKSIQMSMGIVPPLADMARSKRSLAPNIIHALDATLLLYTVELLRKQNIAVSTTHDCFLFLESDQSAVQEAYANACCRFMGEDILLSVLETNLGRISQEDFTSKQKHNLQTNLALVKTFKEQRDFLLQTRDFSKAILKLEVYEFKGE